MPENARKSSADAGWQAVRITMIMLKSPNLCVESVPDSAVMWAKVKGEGQNIIRPLAMLAVHAQGQGRRSRAMMGGAPLSIRSKANGADGAMPAFHAVTTRPHTTGIIRAILGILYYT